MQVWGLPENQDSKLLTVLLCILRVPGLMLLDIWWVERSHLTIPASLGAGDLAEAAVNLAILAMSLSILLLPVSELVEMYMHLLAAALLFTAHALAGHFIGQMDGKPKYGLTILGLAVLSYVLNWCIMVLKGVYAVLFPGLYVVPVIMKLIGLSSERTKWLVETLDVFMMMTTAIYCLTVVREALNYLHQVVQVYQEVRNQLGNHNLLILLVQRALQPPVMVLYWAFLFVSQVWSNYMQIVEKNYQITDEGWHIDLVVAISEVCESPLILISFCTSIMAFSKTVMDLLGQLFTACGVGHVGGDNPLAHTGFAEGIVAFVLALQTGLIDLDMPSKVGATSIILFVVAGSLIQSAFEVVGPVLLALPATNRKLAAHISILLVTAVLLAIPLTMLVAILARVSSDMWLLVVVSSYAVTIVQVLGALATYALFMWDSFQPHPDQYMDEYVFYIKAATNGCELAMAVSIVSGGLYECLATDDEFSLLNISILCVHFYFNIYQRISSGWRTFLARRETKKRLSVLEDASAEELAANQDVCSICYSEMEAAKKTACAHFFHSNCLKRWLFVQDNCPMCTAPIIQVPDSQEDKSSSQPPPPPDSPGPPPPSPSEPTPQEVVASSQSTSTDPLSPPPIDVSAVSSEEREVSESRITVSGRISPGSGGDSKMLQQDKACQQLHQEDPGQRLHQEDPGQRLHLEDPGQQLHQEDPGQQRHLEDPGQQLHQEDPGLRRRNPMNLFDGD